MAWFDALFGNAPGLDEEQKRMMLGRALLSGSAGMMNAHTQGVNPVSAGISSMMGTLDDQQQNALAAQMQQVQRRNMESLMENREKTFSLQSQREERMATQAERDAEMREKEFGLRQDEFGLREDAYGLKASELSRQREMEQRRRQEVEAFMNSLPQTDDPEVLKARMMLRNAMQYGGSMPTQAANVLLPSGRTGGGVGGMFDMLGGQTGMETMTPEPEVPEPPSPIEAESLGAATEIQGDIDTAKQAAINAQQKTVEARAFVDRQLIPAAQGSFGFGGESDAEAIQEIIDRAEEFWPYMGERERAIALEQVRRLKERLR